MPAEVISAQPAERIRRDNRVAKLRQLSWLGVVAFVFAHLPLALAMKYVPALATVHALATLAVGLRWASRGRDTARVAYILAYIAGSEVIWRACEASVFWEYGKYASILIVVVALVRSGQYQPPILPTVYFLLLVPATMITVAMEELSEARGMISFNMSGPLALAVSVAFFMKLRMSPRQLLRTFVAFVAPVAGMVAIIVLALATTDVKFGRQSNPLASGGFGANQVSALLGMACVTSYLCLQDHKLRWALKALFVALMVEFGIQSALTFSRAGVYYTITSIAVGSLLLMRTIRGAIQMIVTLALVSSLIEFVVLPRVDEFTGGKLSARFHNTRLAGRAEIMDADLKIMAEHPILGIGAGRATGERARFFKGFAAHTEFTRLLAEHGSLGCVALVLLVVMGIRNVVVAPTSRGRAVAATLATYSFCFMTGNGMRMMLPAFAFGLAAVTLVPERLAARKAKAVAPAKRINPGQLPNRLRAKPRLA
jgi:hypothetical protein